MRIKQIQLKNGYKRFFDLTIDLGESPKRIIALVGANGCGKSSVLDGMLFQANPWGSIGDKSPKDHLFHSMDKIPNFSHENVVVTFDTGSYFTIREKRAATGQEKTIFSFRSPYRYNSNLQVKESKAVGEIRLNSYGATSSSDLDDKMEQNYRRLNIKFNEYMHASDCKPSEAKQKIIQDLNTSIKNCLKIEISSIGNIESNQGTLYFKKPDHSKTFEFNVLSSGEKEVVDILLDLYLRKSEYTETIFLFDEPELHISTATQKALLLEINKLVGENCQIWIATHSIGLLRALQDELKAECQIIHFTDELNLASSAQVLKPIKPSAAVWQDIFSIALDDLSHLVSPRTIIYCEGRHNPGVGGQETGLDAQVFNNIFSEKFPDTLFVSSGGNTELDQRSEVAISILSKIFKMVEILVLKDRDIASGRTTSQNDRNIYLRSNPSNHRVLYRWEIENYLFDKDVLKTYCAKNSLTFDEVAYDAFVTDIHNQSIKDEVSRIRNFCGIITSINPERFKIELSTHISADMLVFRELEACIFGPDDMSYQHAATSAPAP